MNSLSAEDLKKLRQDAEQGNPEAQRTLGIYLQQLDQWGGEQAAIKWFNKAAKQGDAEAQFRLGLILYDGYYGEEFRP